MDSGMICHVGLSLTVCWTITNACWTIANGCCTITNAMLDYR